jgi:hypothetical protein
MSNNGKDKIEIHTGTSTPMQRPEQIFATDEKGNRAKDPEGKDIYIETVKPAMDPAIVKG